MVGNETTEGSRQCRGEPSSHLFPEELSSSVCALKSSACLSSVVVWRLGRQQELGESLPGRHFSEEGGRENCLVFGPGFNRRKDYKKISPHEILHFKPHCSAQRFPKPPGFLARSFQPLPSLPRTASQVCKHPWLAAG